MRTWRLLTTPPAAGAWNMAVDEAIAAHAGRGDVPPTLRFYQWQPACVSLGRHQALADIDLAWAAAVWATTSVCRAHRRPRQFCTPTS